MKTELFIEKYQIDLTEALGIRINKSINDIRQLNTKNTTFTRTIKIPGTQNNNKIFGFIFSPTREHSLNNAAQNVNFNFTPSRSAKCLIYVDGYVTVKGVIRLLNVIENNGHYEYECTVYGELGGFGSALGEKLLTDLSFSSYNQTWSITNIANSWNNVGNGTSVYYPLIDYGLCSINKVDYNVNALRPAFPVKVYVDKIFQQAGYTYDCPFFNSAFFKKQYIPHNEDDLYKVVSQLMNRSSSSGISNWLTYNTNYNTNVKIAYQNGSLANFSNNASFDEFTYTGTQSASANLTYTINAEYRAQAFSIEYGVVFRVLVNGVAVGYHKVIMNGENPPTVWHPISLGNTAAITLNPGDIVKVDAITYTNPFTGSPLTFWINFISASIAINLVGVQAAPASLGDTLNMDNCIPKNVKQYDLMSSIFNMFNLHIVEDKFKERHLVIRPYVQFYNTSIGSRINWENKIDRGQPVVFTPMSELTNRQINFKYDTDSDYWNERYRKTRGLSYGDLLLATNYEFANGEKDVKLIFAASPLVAKAGVDKVVTAIYKQDSNWEQRMGSKIRILTGKLITGLSSWNLKEWKLSIGTIDSTIGSTALTGNSTSFTTDVIVGDQIISEGRIIGTVATVNNNTSITLAANATASISGSQFYIARQGLIVLGYFPYLGHLDDPTTPTTDLSFAAPKEVFYNLVNPYPGNNLYTVYWKHFMEEITDRRSELMTCFARLTPTDIQNLPFDKYIYVDGALWRLNNVTDYDTEGTSTTKIELLKVIKPLT